MIETPRLEDREALQSAVVHVTVPRAEIQAVMGPAIHEVLDVVHAGNSYAIRLPLVGAFQVENALTAAGLAIATGSENTLVVTENACP